MILLKVTLRKLAIIITEVKTTFLQQWTEYNMKKVVVKILQGTNHVRWANYISSGCKFLIVYVPKIMQIGWQ